MADKNRPEFFSSLAQVLYEAGHDMNTADVFNAIRATIDSQMDINRAKLKGDTGPTGMKGDMGFPGSPGKDAWDPYAVKPGEEMVACEWKGIWFDFPVREELAKGFPSGSLAYGDISIIKMTYGNEVLERMATFWEREYRRKQSMWLFINEEDSCNLTSTDKFNSSPDPLKAC